MHLNKCMVHYGIINVHLHCCIHMCTWRLCVGVCMCGCAFFYLWKIINHIFAIVLSAGCGAKTSTKHNNKIKKPTHKHNIEPQHKPLCDVGCRKKKVRVPKAPMAEKTRNNHMLFPTFCQRSKYKRSAHKCKKHASIFEAEGKSKKGKRSVG